MTRITKRNSPEATFAEVFGVYISAIAARGAKDKIIATYKQHVVFLDCHRISTVTTPAESNPQK